MTAEMGTVSKDSSKKGLRVGIASVCASAIALLIIWISFIFSTSLTGLMFAFVLLSHFLAFTGLILGALAWRHKKKLGLSGIILGAIAFIPFLITFIRVLIYA
jgi:VIT1/CCC1 family predicted Fe2+/Mn2+ transporter